MIAVKSMNPAPDEKKADIQQPITLSFNMKVQQGDEFDQIILEDDTLKKADITKKLEDDTLTVTVQGRMDYDTQYTLIIPENAIVGSCGQKMKESYNLSFVTESSSPEIIFAYPGKDLEDVSLNADLKIKFNQNVLKGPALNNIALCGQDLKKIPASVSLQGEWMYIYPAKNLDKNMKYSLLVPAGVVQNDKAQTMQEDYSLSFKTGQDYINDKNSNESNDKNKNQNNDEDAQKAEEKRLCGNNRVDTAIEIAKKTFENNISNAILADAENYPDALAGSVLAYKLDAPILLVGNNAADQEKVISYLKDNMDPSGTVYILGGTGAVSSSMEEKVSKAGFSKINRLGGKDRYETDVKIAEELGVSSGTPVVLISGENYPDALSISSPAALKQYPLFLVNKNSIPDAIMKEISAINPSSIYIIGLDGTISTAVEDQAAKTLSIDKANIIRIGGKDRFETSIETAKYFDLTGNIICVATGKGFADALAGSIYAAKNNAPIILVDSALSDDEIMYLKSKKISGITIFGGEGAVCRDIEEQLLKLLEK